MKESIRATDKLFNLRTRTSEINQGQSGRPWNHDPCNG